MPIFVIQWPNCELGLIRAEDERDLRVRLDEVADPSGCRWTVCDGPIWIEVRLSVDVQNGLDADEAGPEDVAQVEDAMEGVRG